MKTHYNVDETNGIILLLMIVLLLIFSTVTIILGVKMHIIAIFPGIISIFLLIYSMMFIGENNVDFSFLFNNKGD